MSGYTASELERMGCNREEADRAQELLLFVADAAGLDWPGEYGTSRAVGMLAAKLRETPWIPAEDAAGAVGLERVPGDFAARLTDFVNAVGVIAVLPDHLRDEAPERARAALAELRELGSL